MDVVYEYKSVNQERKMELQDTGNWKQRNPQENKEGIYQEDREYVDIES
jgi:hypothetical protein